MQVGHDIENRGRGDKVVVHTTQSCTVTEKGIARVRLGAAQLT